MKEKINSIIIFTYLVVILLFSVLLKDNEISLVERRKLAQLPEFNINFTDNFDKYATDQFAFRDTFRSIKTIFNLDVLLKKDTNDLVYKDNYIYKLEYPTNYKSIDNFINMINKIKKDTNGNIYLSVIPDKSYYLNNEYLKLDYNYIFDNMSNIDNTKYIPLNDILSINDYYMTDTHWKQTSLIKVIDRLSEYMNFETNNNYEVNKYDNFKGVYYGQLGLNTKKDTLEYLTNNIIENSTVYDIEYKNDKVYDLSKLNSIEPYDVYLNGATSILTITNNNSNNDKELVIFRDSFGSSLTPLLISSYKKITLVDLRYIDYDLISDYVKLNTQDVLFIYSATLINNSNILKY